MFNVEAVGKDVTVWVTTIAMFLVTSTSPIVINVPTRGLLSVETMQAIVQCKLLFKRNMTSIFVNKKLRYNKKM